MIKTKEQRLTIAREYHCGAIERARRLVGLLCDDFFSGETDDLDGEEKKTAAFFLFANRETIVAVLNTVCDILFNLETDLDAAAGWETTATEARKNALMDIYGLTEDKEKAAPSATNTQSGK